MSDIEFVDGLIVKAPHAKAPEFVKGSISIKRKDLGNWLRGKDDEWINLVIKESKGGKWYAAVDTWKPKQPKDYPTEQAAGGGFNDDIPFDQHGRGLII